MEINAKLIKVITGIGTAITLVTGVFFVDDRWNNEKVVGELNTVKNEIINEMRTEVGNNRGGLIALLQMIADDMEFDIERQRSRGEEPPRYMIERFKSTQRLIEEFRNESNPENTN